MGKKAEVVLPAHPHVDKDKREDVVAWTNARETRAREEAIAIETCKILRDKVQKCYRANPVTHYYACADVVSKYMILIRDPRRGVQVPSGVGADE